MLSSIALSLGVLSLSSKASAAQWGYTGTSLAGSYFGIPNNNASFDYVIVGGGTAGLTVASRLAEDPSLSIAVIEAGTFYEISNGNQSQVPMYMTSGWNTQQLIDWDLMTVPQPQLGGRSLRYMQGKCLGGSTGRNQMMYHRGSRGSYDRWAELVGDDGYSWDKILPYFQRSINFTAPDDSKRPANASLSSYNADNFDSAGGPVHLSFPNYAHSFTTHAPAALSKAGLPIAKDFINGILHGHQWNPYTIDPTDQTRSSAETAFLQNIMTSNIFNVKVYTNTQALRILFNGTTATGVSISTAGLTPYVLTAKKEVILSAGVMHSPQLLMVSGIGPKATLEKFDIPVVKDLPGVGQNMKDSTQLGGVTFPVSTISTSVVQADPAAIAAETKLYLEERMGRLTNPGGDYIGWEKIPSNYSTSLSADARKEMANSPADWPDYEFVLNGNVGRAIAKPGVSYGTISSVLVAPISTGNLTIKSNSMADSPLISPNWLLEKTDQEMAVQSYKRLRQFWKGFESIITGAEAAPGANVTSDADILKYLQNTGVGLVHHATSTCMMGKSNETLAVVDSRAKVFGIKKLRIIDASSFRFTPPGHTMGAVYAHAEKLVDDIRKGL